VVAAAVAVAATAVAAAATAEDAKEVDTTTVTEAVPAEEQDTAAPRWAAAWALTATGWAAAAEWAWADP
jgi:hypothetical protein